MGGMYTERKLGLINDTEVEMHIHEFSAEQENYMKLDNRLESDVGRFSQLTSGNDSQSICESNTPSALKKQEPSTIFINPISIVKLQDQEETKTQYESARLHTAGDETIGDEEDLGAE